MNNEVKEDYLNPEFLDSNINSNQTIKKDNEFWAKRDYEKEKMNPIFKIILILIILLVIGAIGLGTYYVISLKNPKILFTKISSEIFGSFDKVFNINYNPENSMLLSGDISLTTDVEELKMLNNQKLNYEIGIDLKNNKAELGFAYDDNNKKILDYDIEIKNNNAYLFLNEIYEKIILFDQKTIEDSMGMSINDIFEKINEFITNEKVENIKYIKDELEKITNKALNELKYETTKEKLEINGKNISTTKMSIVLNKENITILANTYINEISKNEELIKNIIGLYNIEESKFKEMLNDAKESISEIEEPAEIVKFSLYTSGLLSKIVKISLEDEENSVYFINHKEYKNFNFFNEFIIEIKDKNLSVFSYNELVLTGTVNKLDKNNLDFIFENADAENKIKGDIVYINDNKNQDLKINFNYNEELKIYIEHKSNKVNDKEINNNSLMKLEADSKSISIISNQKLEIQKEIATKDTSNNINYNVLTEKDEETIRINTEKQLENSSIGKYYLSNFQKAKESTFLSEAEMIRDSVEDLMLYQGVLGNLESNKRADGTYCFSVKDLKNKGYIDSYIDIDGKITVMEINNVYYYNTTLYNDVYYIKTSAQYFDEANKIRENPNAILNNIC